ncbi:hypothetical protein A5757_17390 [Mycobacterium sp. 852013-51886_SCH5428379]|uniref:hypothetical protein n=1 Tax=Mycobacterium sp. 852013-51886_SCH5428379 TaxID=1834111 RepID=UPI0007FBB8CF|nr:hypothetical protein [Mycobacterium sp. 852013-51886_SCH5428379]OBB58265.1 hypothetical protein A5757_17390 [Mycobacterium sp. 852013-51886_SCH5428379]
MTFTPVVPPAILAVVVVALLFARLVTLRQVLAGEGAHRRKALLRWSGMSLAVVLLLFAAMRPALITDDTTEAEGAGADTNVFVVADRTVDARADIETLIERYPAARFGVITFAPPALMWPLSADVWSLPSEVAALAPLAPGDPAQADAAAPGNVLRYQLIQAQQRYPGSANLVVYAGAGAPGTQTAPRDLDVVAATVDGGIVLGHPAAGELNESALRAIAAELGVPYVNRAGGGALPDLEVRRPAAPSVEPAPAAARIELYWLLALVAAGLLLAEVWISVRELRHSRVARRDVTR